MIEVGRKSIVRAKIRDSFAYPGTLATMVALLLAAMSVSIPLSAQEQGPLPAAAPQNEDSVPLTSPPASSPRQVSASPAQPAPTAPPRQASGAAISKNAPSIPVDQIIQQFAQREAEFREERDNFTYVQDFVIQTVTSSG